MKFTSATSALAVGVSFFAIIVAADARDHVQVAGSSTVLPYATIVSEEFGNASNYPSPIIESGGSSAGLKQFCQGVGENTIDVANSSRPMREKEIAACKAAGVEGVHEVKFGYDGIVFAYDIDGGEMAFEPSDWYRALATQIVVDGKLVDNPYTRWNEVNANFPAWEIAAYIPGEKHGTREVFEEKVLAAGCETTGALEVLKASGMDKKAAHSACIKVRTDGKSVDIDGDYTETLARIESNKTGVGVFGLAFYQNNTDKLQVSTMGGIVPTVETISSGEYPVSRPLYFYVKQAHIGVIPGLAEYVEYFLSEEMAGPFGPLAEYGLVALPEDERQAELAQFSEKEAM